MKTCLRSLALALVLALLCGCAPAARPADAPAPPAPAPFGAPTDSAGERDTPDSPANPADNPDTPAAPPEKTVLRMAVWNDPERGTPITDFVADFNSSQDEILIEVEQYQLDDIEQARRDSADRVYASFFSGDAPDLYLMYNFDENAMRNAGLLADWYPLMDGDGHFSREDYQQNIWQAMEQGGALYTMVTSFDLFGIGSANPALSEQLGWTMDEFSAWMAENNGLIARETVLELLLSVGLKDFVSEADNTCQFETAEFDQWLQLLRASPGQNELQLTADSWMQLLFASQLISLARYNTDRLRDEFTLYYVGVPGPGRSGPAIMLRQGFGLSAATDKADAC